eukprot:symbB.v1.2.015751.t1/scaffold1123.1/size136624/16
MYRSVQPELGLNDVSAVLSLDVELPNKDNEISCEALNAAETSVDIGGKIEDLLQLQLLLAQWRRNFPKEQPSCRETALHEALCRDSKWVLNRTKRRWTTMEFETMWEGWMAELASHELDPVDCRHFGQDYVEKGWNPQVFHWGKGFVPTHLATVLRDQEFVDNLLGIAFESDVPTAEFVELKGKRFRIERVQALSHLRALANSAPTLDLEAINQIVEFGAGSGEMAALCFHLGFNGRYMIYDLPQMILSQRFWLRRAGLPAVLGASLDGDPFQHQSEGWLFLESKRSGFAKRLAVKAENGQRFFRAFFGFYSFTEADEASRARLRPFIENFEVILLTYWQQFDAVDNLDYLEKWSSTLGKSHHLLSWSVASDTWLDNWPLGYYFLALDKTLGELECVWELNCRPSTVVPRLTSKHLYDAIRTSSRRQSRVSLHCVLRTELGLLLLKQELVRVQELLLLEMPPTLAAALHNISLDT